MKVSYVLTTFNSEEYIKENLKAIKNQSHQNMEIIVVDNCSSDATRDIIEEKFPDVNLIVTPNSNYGACETFNIGFETAREDYIVILDDDTIISESFTERLLKSLEKFDCDAVVPKIIDDKNGNQREHSFEHGSKIQMLWGNASLVRKKAIKSVNYYDKNFFIAQNDRDLAERLVRSGYEIRSNSNAKAIHKRDPEEKISNWRLFYETRNSLLRAWRNYSKPDGLVLSMRSSLMWLKKTNSLRGKLMWLKANLAAIPLSYKYLLRSDNIGYKLKYTPDPVKSALERLKKYY